MKTSKVKVVSKGKKLDDINAVNSNALGLIDKSYKTGGMAINSNLNQMA